ncbi:MAG: ABC transporter permease [Chloroflexota bacterium]
MNGTLAIAERELKSYFVSPVAYVITAAYLVITGVLFSIILIQTSEASLRYLFGNISVVWLFVTPMITMRLIAEEIRSGTIELLLTNPVREIELVLGKFLGALGFTLVMLSGTLLYPAALYLLGSPDHGPMIAGYVGVILQASAFIAIGLFASSLTQNQIVAAVLTFAFLLVMWLSDSVANSLSGRVADVVRYLSITSHFQDFSRGIVDTTHIVYFASLVVGALSLSFLSLQSRRWRA